MSNETFKKLQEINSLNKDDCKNTETDEVTKESDVKEGEETKEETVAEEKTESQEAEKHTDSDEEKKDVEFPSVLSSEEKEKLLKKLSEKKDKPDGKVLKDNNDDESIHVTWRDYIYVMTTFYGNWFYFVIIWSMSALSYSFVVQHQLVMA